jgi:DNA primase
MKEEQGQERIDVERVKASYKLSDEVQKIVKLKRNGDEFSGLCPFHNEKTPSFTVNDKKGFYHCFGCGAHGSIIDWVMQTENLTFVDALKKLSSADHLIHNGTKKFRSKSHILSYTPEEQVTPNRAKAEAINDILRRSVPVDGTIAEAYLRSRGILMPIPKSVRFVDKCRVTMHPRTEYFPAMIGVVKNIHDQMIAVHRTFLTDDGSDKRSAYNGSAKVMLGKCMGSAVRLSPLKDRLYLAEGIETALSILQARPNACVWAALSCNGMGGLNVPKTVREVIFCADNDTKNPSDAAYRQVAKLVKSGVPRVTVKFPPEGMDFNDVLQASDLDINDYLGAE